MFPPGALINLISMQQKNLYFLRHAIALPRGTRGIRDEERPLTEEGEKRMIKAAKGMRQLGLSIEVLLSSPLVRAIQTAEIVKEHLGISAAIEIDPELKPGGNLKTFLEKIRKRNRANFLLTGHEPAMSYWIEDLLGCGRTGSILLKKGALCHLQLDFSENPPDVEMRFLLQPKILRNLG